MAEGSHRNAAQFVELARLLNHPGIQGYTELLEEQAAEFRKTQTGFVINIVGNAIVSLVAIWKIVNVVA